MNPISHRRLLLAIIALGVLLRGILAIRHPLLFDDSFDYFDLANRILTGQPYALTTGDIVSHATRMPGYPLFLAAILRFAGDNFLIVTLVQALLSAGIILLTYRLAALIHPRAGLLAALLIALDPLTIGFSAALLSEMPYTLLLLLSLFICLKLLTATPRRLLLLALWLLLGVTWALSVYMRASALYCLLPLGLVVVFAKPSLSHVAGLAVACVMLIAFLIPWFLFTQHPPRLTSLEGISLYEAVYPGADGGPKQDVIPLTPAMTTMTEWQRDAEWNRLAWIDIKSNPARIAHLALTKFARTWSPWLNGSDLRSPLVQSALILWQVPLFLLALLGLFTKMPRGLKPLLLTPILYFSALHSLFLGSVRYRVPLMPLLCIFAAAGAVTCVNRFLAKRTAASGV